MSFWDHFRPSTYFAAPPAPTLRMRVDGMALLQVRCLCELRCGAARIGVVTQLHHHFDSRTPLPNGQLSALHTNVVAELDRLGCSGATCEGAAVPLLRRLSALIPGRRVFCINQRYLKQALVVGGAPVDGRVTELKIE